MFIKNNHIKKCFKQRFLKNILSISLSAYEIPNNWVFQNVY